MPSREGKPVPAQSHTHICDAQRILQDLTHPQDHASFKQEQAAHVVHVR